MAGDPRQDPRRVAADPRAAAMAASSAAATNDATGANTDSTSAQAPPPPPPPPPPHPNLLPPPPAPPSQHLPQPPTQQQQQQQHQQQSILFGRDDDAMEDDEEDEDVNMMDPSRSNNMVGSSSTATTTPTSATATATTLSSSMNAVEPIPLPVRIMTPSPFPHHSRGATTSARFRNALSRVTTHPTSDSEAWSALVTEIQTSCWRQQLQPNLHLRIGSVEVQSQLDFIISCYGALIYNFPYAIQYYIQLGEILLQASARPGESGGPKNLTSAVDTKRCITCEGQLETIFQTILNYKTGTNFGIVIENNTKDDDNDKNKTIFGGITATTKKKKESAQEKEQEIIQQLSFLQSPTAKSSNHDNDGDVTMAEGVQSQTSSDNIAGATTPKMTTTTTATTDNELKKVLGGMGTWNVQLWMLYLQKVHRDLNRHYRTMSQQEGTKWLREKMIASYELALEHVAFSYNNHLLWQDYISYIKSWTSSAASLEDLDPIVQQQQMIQLRSVYQRLVQLPMTGLDNLWQEYESFEKSHSEELASALLTEYTPKYQHARTVYLERARVYNYTGDLQLGRLATPPVTRNNAKRSGGGGAGMDSGGGTDDVAAAGGGGGGGIDGKETLEDYLSALQEEYQLLQAWKKRVSYERTNPERVAIAELPRRMRQAYMEMISVLTRHPEVWHMWGMYEYYHASKPVRAMAVLQLGLQHIPDCTLLAHSLTQLVESYCSTTLPSLALQVLERFIQISPNTLAFCLYQQMVRRYRGIQPAREVFARARRVLTGELDGKSDGMAKEGGEETKDDGADDGNDGNDASGPKRWMVTNRLDPDVGRRRRRSDFEGLQPDAMETTSSAMAENGNETTPKVAAGPITWHLYASHATMEHRLNHFPEIAARVYELGLRNHPHFLTQPPFVLRYAQLLLELNDTVNLRALLTRAVSAATDEDGTAPSSGPKAQIAAVLWDMALQFETILSGADPMADQLIQDVERKRHMAIMGPDLEDVATGGYQLEATSTTTIGAQKTTIAEQLIRNDGYDVSSTLVNGMARSVSVLEVMGLWGSNVVDGGVSIKRSQPNKAGMDFLEDEENTAERSGGDSDATYQKRLLYQRLYESGILQGSGGGLGGVDVGGGAASAAAAGNKILSARERLATAGGGTGTSAAVNVAIQQQPEWIRPLLLILPASKLRLTALTKPPLHLTEMALLQLRQSTLPSERPQDDNGGDVMSPRSAKISGQKRTANGDDSSDEEDNGGSGGGYGMQFRSRQRARQIAAGGDPGPGDQ